MNGGRIEVRKCYVSTDISWLLERNSGWSSVQAIIAVVRETTKNDHKTAETSYYISSKKSDAETLLQAIRDHWKIESLHWQLDVIFSEDDCAVVSENGQLTLNIFRKYALAMHKHYIASTGKKVSMRKNMFRCLLDEALLLDVIACPL
jgi:predicted transposase YbfD/YdcC